MTEDISLYGAPNSNYEKLFKKFSEIDTLDVSEWNATHILGYFCKKYKETYQAPYKFKFNSSAPSKCFEIFQVKKLSSLLTSQPNLLKEYIDWVFLNKVTKAKRKLTSISFLTIEATMNEYKFNVLLSDKQQVQIDRSTPLPDKFKQILSKHKVSAATYGDLAFINQIQPPVDSFSAALDEMVQLGFDKAQLAKIV